MTMAWSISWIMSASATRPKGSGPVSSLTFADLNGDGTVNSEDVNLVRPRISKKLPPPRVTTRVKAMEARARIAPARMVLNRHWNLRLEGRFPRG